jgi:hypothetical protein
MSRADRQSDFCDTHSMPVLAPSKKEQDFDSRSVWRAELLYPANFEADVALEWDEASITAEAILKVTLPDTVCARIFWIHS